MHVNKSFKKNRQRSDPPPILPMPDFGNIWSGYPSLKGHSPKKGKMWEVLRGGGVPKVLKLKINEYIFDKNHDITLAMSGYSFTDLDTVLGVAFKCLNQYHRHTDLT